MNIYAITLLGILAAGLQEPRAEPIPARANGLCSQLSRESAEYGRVALAWEALVEDGFAGSAIVRVSGKTILCASAGQASAVAAFRPSTLVDVASVAKPVTAMALIKLEEEGALSLDDPLGKYFPAAPADKADLPLWRLMTHSSGLADLPDGVDDRTSLSRDEMAARSLALPVVLSPGEDWSYSNSAFNLLAQVVEKASGTAFETYIQREILAPAGAIGGFDPAAFPTSIVADTMTREGWLNLSQVSGSGAGPFWGLWGAGGLYMSVEDLAAVFEAFAAGSIVSADRARSVIDEGRFKVADLGYYTLLMARMDRIAPGLHFHDRARLHFHAGGSDHSTAQIRWYPDREIIIAVVSNIGIDPGRETPNRLSMPVHPGPNALIAAEALDRAFFDLGDGAQPVS